MRTVSFLKNNCTCIIFKASDLFLLFVLNRLSYNCLTPQSELEPIKVRDNPGKYCTHHIHSNMYYKVTFETEKMWSNKTSDPLKEVQFI
jgi:hypothetical protein